VSSADRFIALLVTILTGVTIIAGGITVVLRVLWNIRGSWDATNNDLKRLVDKMENMSQRDDRLDRAVERHLDWHDKH
jgi:hypothetical protein